MNEALKKAGFELVPPDRGAACRLDPSGRVSINGVILTELAIEAPERFCNIYYDPKTSRVAVELLKERPPEGIAHPVRRGPCKTKGAQGVMLLHLKTVLSRYSLRLMAGSVPMEWDPATRVFTLDIGSLKVEGKRPARNVEALPG